MAIFKVIRGIQVPTKEPTGLAGIVLNSNFIDLALLAKLIIEERGAAYVEDQSSKVVILDAIGDSYTVTLPNPQSLKTIVKHFRARLIGAGNEITILGVKLKKGNDQVSFISDDQTWTVFQKHLAEEFKETLDEANAFTTAAIAALTPAFVNLAKTAGGRLSITKDVPVTPEKTLQGIRIFYTPFTSDTLAIWSGTEWRVRKYDNPSLSVPAKANTNYDIFAKDGITGVEIDALEWFDDTQRDFDIERKDGIWVLEADDRFTLLGSFRTTGTGGFTADENERRLIWNLNNRVQRPLSKTQSTTNWNYAGDVFRAANNDPANKVEVMVGLEESMIELGIEISVIRTQGPTAAVVGIGINSTTVNDSTTNVGIRMQAAIDQIATARLRTSPGQGYTAYQWIEKTSRNGENLLWTANSPGDRLAGLIGSIDT